MIVSPATEPGRHFGRLHPTFAPEKIGPIFHKTFFQTQITQQPAKTDQIRIASVKEHPLIILVPILRRIPVCFRADTVVLVTCVFRPQNFGWT